MKNALIAIAFLIGAAGAHAQATTAVKEAGKAAAAAIGRRLGNEIDEIRSATKAAKDAATR